jgi:hypothetical protein
VNAISKFNQTLLDKERELAESLITTMATPEQYHRTAGMVLGLRLAAELLAEQISDD